MKFKNREINFGWSAWVVLLLLLLLGLMLTNPVSADMPEDVMWVTICYTPPAHPENAQTMTVYWSMLDKCLSCYHATLGPCP